MQIGQLVFPFVRLTWLVWTGIIFPWPPNNLSVEEGAPRHRIFHTGSGSRRSGRHRRDDGTSGHRSEFGTTMECREAPCAILTDIIDYCSFRWHHM